MVILLNRKACGERAGAKWESIKEEILVRLGNSVLIESNENVESNLLLELKRGERRFISAGGDGTINFLINFLAKNVDSSLFKKIQIGAIGLGSSNDFHKPFGKEKSINGIPARIDFAKTSYQDLGKVEWYDANEIKNESYWINNASIGITAEANYFFNNPNLLLENLKRISTHQAIIYAAIKTISTFKNISLLIKENNSQETPAVISNLGIVKNPNFSGSFCYDSPYLRNSGEFYVHILNGLDTFQTLRMLYNLSKKRFMGLDGTKSLTANEFLVRSEIPFALEYDGEVIKTKKAQFTLINNGVQLCA